MSENGELDFAFALSLNMKKDYRSRFYCLNEILCSILSELNLLRGKTRSIMLNCFFYQSR